MEHAASALNDAAAIAAMPPPVVITDLSNEEFLGRYAGAGRIGLSGGITLIDNVIAHAERLVDEHQARGLWSHAFLFQGRRADGHHWVIESDLQAHRKHIQFGVQENRVSKYHDEGFYTTLAVLDFGLSEAQAARLVGEGLEMVAARARYSIRELAGTYIALRRPEMRGRKNPLARESSIFCSALIHHLFQKTGVDLVPGVHPKNTTPGDLSRSPLPHAAYLLQRPSPPDALTALKTRVRGRVQARLEKLKSVRRKSRTGKR